MKYLFWIVVMAAFLPGTVNAAPKRSATEAVELRASAEQVCGTTVGISTWCRASYSASSDRALVTGHVGSLPERMEIPVVVSTQSTLVSRVDVSASGASMNNRLSRVVVLRSASLTAHGMGATPQSALADALANYADENCGLNLSDSTALTSGASGKGYRSNTTGRTEEHATCVIPGYRVTASRFSKTLDQWQITIKTGG